MKPSLPPAPPVPELAPEPTLQGSARPPLTAEQFCHMLLTSGELSAKLAAPRGPDGRLLPLSEGAAPQRIAEPARAEALRMRPGAEPLPRLAELHDPQARALCLERFAHHELQAIELFAWMLLAFPGPPLTPGLRRALLLTLEEEQRHLRLYLDRLAAHGWGLGRSQLSDYLWQHHEGVLRAADPALAFLCAMGLTFEQANLDFTLMYRDGFRAAGDVDSALVLQRVHTDEIRHVRVAMHWLRRLKDPLRSDVEAYRAAVPFPLSAARAKGRRFDIASRHRAGLSDDFIAHVRAARPYGPRPPQAQAGAAHPTASPPQDVAHPEAARGKDAPRLWLLPNLGAEEDRPLPASARGFLRGLLGAWAALFDAATAGPPLLLPPGDAEAQASWREALAAGRAGSALPCLGEARGVVAWLGTQSAAEQAAELGQVLAGPAPAVVRTVHDKAFAHRQALAQGLLPAGLEGLVCELGPEALLAPDAAAAIARQVAAWPAWTRGRFTLKPRHGTSGRGRVMGTAALPAPLRPPLPPGAAHPALAQLARRGGCLLEPWLDRTADLSIQLYVHPQGRIEVLGTTTQILTQSGQILGNRGLLTDGGVRSGAPAATEQELQRAAAAVGAAAAQAGFYGVAGIDAFTFIGPDGGELLRPVVELNARYTTGTVALGLLRHAEHAGLTRGMRAWALVLKARRSGPDADLTELRTITPLAPGPTLVLARTPAQLDGWLASTAGPERD